MKNRIIAFLAERLRSVFRVLCLLFAALLRRLRVKRKKLVPIVGNEVIRHADVLWKEGRWKRDYPVLWRLWKKAEDWQREKWPNGAPKYLFHSSLAVVILLFTGVVSWFSLHAEIAKFYPSTCLGGWQNTKNAEGIPELSPGADASKFNDTNSALLEGAASQIFCGSFTGEIPKDAEMKTLLVKLSWSLGGSTSNLETEPLSEVSVDTGTSTENVLSAAAASSTVSVSLGEEATSSMQKILDAPSDAALEIHLEDTPPLVVPSPTETPALETTNDEKTSDSSGDHPAVTTLHEEGSGTTDAPATEIPAPATEQTAPVSFFQQLFRQAFAQEIQNVTSTPALTENSDSAMPEITATTGVVERTMDDATSTDGDQVRTSSTTEEEQPLIPDSFLSPAFTAASPEFLEVLYTLDGTTWHSLGKVSKAELKDEFKIPVTKWDDISKLQISVQSLPSVDSLPKVYLDGMWLEAEYKNLSTEEVAAAGSGTISSVGNVDGPTSSLSTENINGTEAYVLTLDNPGLAPDYKYEFLDSGVRLLSVRGGKQKELMSGVNPIPEYRTVIGVTASSSGTTEWQAYSLTVLPASGTYSGWREDRTGPERQMIREFGTDEEGTGETFTETWTIPESAEDLGNKGPKATYKMTKNNPSPLSWRLRLAYNGIKDVKKDDDDMKDKNDYPIRNRVYGDFSIDVRDFDVMEAADGKPRHTFSEKDGGAEALFFPEGTDGERLVDPTTVTAGVATGWGHNKTRAVFYTGDRYWLLYTDATGKIYYKSSTDNSTWTATTTLVVNMSTTNIDFDTFLVDNSKFDIGYPNASEDPLAVTVTMSGATLATSTASAVGAATTCNTISITRTPSTDRIFLSCRNSAQLEVYSANQTGDANGITTWTTEISGATETELVNQMTLAPYGASDTVLVIYERDSATNSNDCIWSRAITRSGGAGTAKSVNCNSGTQFASNTFGNVARTAPSTFSFLYSDMSGTVGLREAVWDGNAATWATTTSVVSGAGIKSPSLFYDNVTGDLYAFASTSSSVVYYKKTGGSWGSAITADAGEGTSRDLSTPITQMEMKQGEQTFLPWAYRTTNGANFDLKVGTLGLHGTTTQRAYIFLNDDGANVDSYTKAHSAATSTSITGVKVGERLIARIQVDNITTGTSTKMYRLQWENNTDAAGTWNDLSSTTAIRWSLSGKGAIGSRYGEVPLPTAQLGVAGACVTAGTTYQAGRFVAGTATSSVISLGPSKCTEFAFAVETSGATLGKTYRLRVVNGASGLAFDQAPLNGSYAQYPTFTIESARTLTYSKEARGGTATTTLDAVNNAQYTSLAIGSDGFPFISYHDNSAGDLIFAKCNNTACTAPTISILDSADNVGSYNSVAIGTDGFPVISYYNSPRADLIFAKCNNTACTSAATSTLDVVNNTGVYTSLAIGTDGFPVISYQDSTLGDLKFAKCNNAACTSAATSTLDVVNNTGQYTSIAIGTDGFPVISYYDSTAADLKFAKCNNAACTSVATSTLDATAGSGIDGSIAIGSDGFPAMSYQGGAGRLRFAKCNNTACTSVATSTLDAVNSSQFTSIAIGTDGFPVISYRSVTGIFGLKVAKCNNISCSSAATSTLDSVLSAGRWSSIAIGIDGYPVISYQIPSTGDLKFARCSSIDCATTGATANLPSDAQNLDTFLDDGGYTNVATSDNLYDSLSAATSSRLAYNFKKATSSNTDQISVTWEGQIDISTSTSLQIYNNSSLAWETIGASSTPTAGADLTLTGFVLGPQYYDASFLVASRIVTGTTTQTTTLKTDQITIQFVTPTLTQRDYIFLNDDGADVDSYTVAHSAATSSSISNVKKGERLIARIQVDNTGTGTSTNQYRLQYDKNDSNWNDVGTTTEIRSSLSTKGALWGRPDGVPLATKQVTSSCSASTVYTAGRFVAGTATSTTFDIGPAKCTEIAYAFETSGATLGQIYRLRVVLASTTIAFNTYAAYPTFTIESARTLTYSKEARGGYATSTIDSTGTVGEYSSLAIGSDGFPVMSYYRNTGGDLGFAKCNDPSCSSFSTSTLDVVNNTGQYTSIAIGTDGFPVISYYDSTAADLKFAKCNNISCTSAATSTIDAGNSIGQYTSIAIGTDGFPVISYYRTTGADLGFAKCNNISCSSAATSTLDSTGNVGQDTSVAIGTDGFPVISYYDSSALALKFAKCNNISCSSVTTSTLDAGYFGDSTGRFTSIAIGSDGFPIMAYFDTTAWDISFTKCNNVSCTSTSTNEFLGGGDNSIRQQISLAIGADGFPVMSYRGGASELRFLKCGDLDCQENFYANSTFILDEGNDDDGYTSLAIGTDGFPVISYYDATLTALRFAKCSSIDCATTGATANLPSDAQNLDTFLDDAAYTNVASSDNLYDSLSAATSSRLAYNFKRATTTNTGQIIVTWEGQVSVATSTSLQIYNNSSSAWETLQTNTSPTPSTDFTLTGTQSTSPSSYYDGSNSVAVRLVTGTTTAATTLKTDQITIQFVTPTLTQRDYIFLNDDGADVDSYTVAHSAATSSSISNVKKGERLIARIQVDNTGTGTSTNQYRLQYDKNDSNWNDVGTTTEIRSSLSVKGALWGRPDGVPLVTKQVTSSCSASTVYTAGRFVAGTATSTTFDIGPAKCTEIAYAFETSGATLGQLYRLRVVSASTTIAFDTYAAYPTFTIESARTLTYSKEARGGTATTTLDVVGFTGYYPSIAIGTDGFPVIAHQNAALNDLKFTKCNDTSCRSSTSSTLDSASTFGYYNSIAIGSDGFPVISYYSSTAGDLKFAKCNNAACTAPTISILDSGGNVGSYTSIAIGTDGFPVISYYYVTAGDLKFIKCNNLSCSSVTTSTLDVVNSTGLSTSLAIGTDGFPVISYFENTAGDLKFAKCNNTACTSAATSTLDVVGVAGQYASIAIGIDGFPVISYQEANFGDLKFAKCNNTACTSAATSTLDVVGTILYTSLAIGSDGFPVISYVDTLDNLKFAKCNNTACTSAATSTLDVTGTIQYSSIAIGTDGFPVISYNNSHSASELEFMKCNSIDCAPASSATANLPSTAQDLDTFLDDAGYTNVATSDNLYDSLSAATSTRLAYNFKRATTTNTDQITVTWEGQVSVATTTSLQIYNNSSGAWETLQTNTSPTPSTDFTLTGAIAGGTQYFDGSNIVAVRAATGTTTQATTLKTDQIVIAFSPAASLTFTATTNSFGSLTPGNYKIATTTLNVTTNGLNGYSVAMYGNNQGSGGASTTLYLSPTTYTTSIADQTEWVPGAATTSAGNAVVRGSLDSAGQVLAFRVMSASGSVPFLSTTWWGASDADGTAKWTGVASSTVSRQIGNSSSAAPSGVLNTVQYYLDTPINQIQGNYTGDITFTAVTNP